MSDGRISADVVRQVVDLLDAAEDAGLELDVEREIRVKVSPEEGYTYATVEEARAFIDGYMAGPPVGTAGG